MIETELVTNGKFTSDAKDFASENGIQLIDGPKLTMLVASVQKSGKMMQSQKEAEMACPKCGSKMVLRTATKGSNAGKNFWGCSNFPNCCGIVNYAE